MAKGGWVLIADERSSMQGFKGIFAASLEDRETELKAGGNLFLRQHRDLDSTFKFGCHPADAAHQTFGKFLGFLDTQYVLPLPLLRFGSCLLRICNCLVAAKFLFKPCQERVV